MYKKIIQEIKKNENNNDLSYLNNVKLNPEHGKKIAQAYQDMKHDPDHPEVQKAYSALIDETKQQFNDMMNKGLKISRIEPGMENPYKSSKELHNDVKNNNHLWYFPTESGFGDNEQLTKHPMLQSTGVKHGDKELLANDMFRIVHDINGHHLGGESGFGPTGEHKAYLTHKKMYSPLASKALASETLGQNSWVNFGPHAEHNQKNPNQTVYAEQKAGLLPEEIVNGDWHKNEIQKGELMEILKNFALTKSYEYSQKYPKISQKDLKKNFNKLLRNGVALLGLVHAHKYMDMPNQSNNSNKLIPESNISQEFERDRKSYSDKYNTNQGTNFSDKQKKIDNFLKTTSMIESSGGKNLKHPRIKYGMHAGDKAVGQWALMPKTIKELAGRMGDNSEIAPYAKMDSKKISQNLSQNPGHEKQIASFLANKLYDKFSGDENKMAYAWNQGHNINPDSFKTDRKDYLNHDYVKKYNEYKTNNTPKQEISRSIANFDKNK
jgi:hypothetical protein